MVVLPPKSFLAGAGGLGALSLLTSLPDTLAAAPPAALAGSDGVLGVALPQPIQTSPWHAHRRVCQFGATEWYLGRWGRRSPATSAYRVCEAERGGLLALAALLWPREDGGCSVPSAPPLRLGRGGGCSLAEGP